MRLILCIGDRPETGGYIEHDATMRSPTINGFKQAFVGSKAFCDACQSYGLIEKSGGPSRRKHGEREIALDDDILRCQCKTPPKMKATTQSIARHDDSIERLGQVIPGEILPALDLPCVAPRFDEQVRILNAAECQDYPYRVEPPHGRNIEGCLDETGFLPRVNTALHGDTYYIVWGDEALTER